MSHTENGDPNVFPTSLTVPDDGDELDVASVNIALEGLADRTAWLKAHKVEPGPIARALAPFEPMCSLSDRIKSASFVNDAEKVTSPNEHAFRLVNGRLFVTRHNAVYVDSTTFGFLFYLNPHVVDGATLSSVVARVQAASAHSNLPDTQMSMGVFRTPALSSSTYTSLRSAGDWATDAQGSLAAYEAAHNITATLDQNNTIDKSTYNYWIQFWDEFGANSVAGNELFGFTLNMTVGATVVP